MWEAINELKRLGYWIVTGGRRHVKEYEDHEIRDTISGINHSISKGGTSLADASGILFKRNLNNKMKNLEPSTMLGYGLGIIVVLFLLKG